MKESLIRAEALKRLHAEGFVVWWPEKTRSYGSKDIFGVFDLVCQRPGYLLSRYIQLTDATSHAKRRRKVEAFLLEHDLMFWCEIWSWNAKAERFRIEELHTPNMSAVSERS